MKSLIRQLLARESLSYAQCYASTKNMVQIITPHNQEERGCQLSLRIEKLIKMDSLEHVFLRHGVVCDVRPGVIRE